jgi:hypothetical protein
MATEPVAALWESKRTAETRMIEDILRKEFPNSDAYRYNSASIRVRVIDEGFEGKSIDERERMVSPLLETLPEETQADIMILLTLTPEETRSFDQKALVNLEFEHPSRSML